MEALQALVPMVFTISLSALVAAVGLDAEPGDLLYLIRRPVELAKAVLAVNVIVPLAAMALVALFPLTPMAKAGVLLMAVSPAPPLVPGKGLKVGARKCYIYGLYFALIMLAIVLTPLTVAILAPVYHAQIALPPALVARNVALTVVLPLAAGLVIGRLAPRWASRAAGPVRTMAMLLLLAAVVPVVVAAWPGMVSLVGNGTIVAMAATAACGLIAGHRLGGPEPSDRAALAVTAATRHPGLALMIASTNGLDKSVSAAVLDMLLVGLVMGIGYQFWLKRRPPLAAPAGG
jgi:BASS family bile acid:Na+ symporter